MEVKCDNCSARYRIGEDKFGSKQRIRIRCKRCGEFIQIDNPALKKGGPPPMDAESDDIFSESLPNKNELLFDDSQETQVFSQKKHAPSAMPPAAPPVTPPAAKAKEGDSGFQSNFQLTFDDQTSQFDQKNIGNAPSVDFSSGGGMFVNQNRPPEAVQHNTMSASGADPSLDFSPGKGPDTNFQSGSGNHNSGNNRRRTESRQQNNSYTPPKQGGSIGGKLFMLIFILFAGFIVFVLFKNDWNVNLNDVPGMVKSALNNSASSSKEVVSKKKDQTPLSEQFQIAKTEIKAEMIRIKKGKYALSIQGKVKNISTNTRNLISIGAKVFDLERNLLFSKGMYAGNYFTSKQIRRAKTEGVFDALYVQSGINGMNWGVTTGQEIPFMIVFYTDKRLNLKHTNLEIKVISAQ